MFRRLALILSSLCLLSGLSGCSTSGPDDDDDDIAGPGNWNVEIVNNAVSTMEVLRRRPCPSDDEGDWSAIPIGPEGLTPGSTERIFLPQPGCFDLSAQGEGCSVGGTTGPMQAGDLVTWTITEADLLCEG